jgi:hypothetical protein
MDHTRNAEHRLVRNFGHEDRDDHALVEGHLRQLVRTSSVGRPDRGHLVEAAEHVSACPGMWNVAPQEICHR